jgi:hypothetical protein
MSDDKQAAGRLKSKCGPELALRARSSVGQSACFTRTRRASRKSLKSKDKSLTCLKLASDRICPYFHRIFACFFVLLPKEIPKVSAPF